MPDNLANTSPPRGYGERFRLMLRIFSITFNSARMLFEVGKNCKTGEDLSPKAQMEINSIQTKWAHDLLKILDLKVTVVGKPLDSEPCLWVSNHMGYVDIPLLLSLVPFAFVAKKAVSRWPGFGRGAALIGGIFVDRKSHHSRKQVGFDIAQSIKKKNKGIIIFPEGTSTIAGKPWKHGSFLIAEKHKIRVQPLWFCYRPVRPLSYVGSDTFVSQLWRLLALRGSEALVVFGEAFEVEDADTDCKRIEAWVHSSVRQQLKKWGWVESSS